MSRLFPFDLRSFEMPTLLQSLHWAARGVYRGLGYRWEIHRKGDQKLGYWKIRLRARNPAQSYPKRLVLVPGFGDTALSWQGVILRLMPVLKQEFDEVVLLDYPGYAGFLNRERFFPSLDQMLESTCDVLDYLKPHTLLAHSLGGWLAGHYASQCGLEKRPLSNRLNYSGPKSLILVNPSGVYTEDRIREEMVVLFNLVAEEGFLHLRPHLFRKEPFWFRMIASQYQKLFRREDLGQFIKSVKSEQALQESLIAIKSKVWVIWGDHDTLVPPSCAGAWMSFLNSELKHQHHVVILKNTGHSPQVESPWALSVVIGQILKQITPGRIGKKWWNVLPQSLKAVLFSILIPLAVLSKNVRASDTEWLGQTCEIWEDDQSIPHIRAKGELLGYACLGYVHGRNRAWQMDYFKKIGEGRKSEFIGSDGIRSDFFMRLLGLKEKAEALYTEMTPDKKEVFQAYAWGAKVGIRAAIKGAAPGAVPRAGNADGLNNNGVYEFFKLGYQPDEWKPQDSLLLLLLQSFDQTRRSFENQLKEVEWANQQGPLASQKFSSEGLPWDVSILKPGEYPTRLSSSNLDPHLDLKKGETVSATEANSLRALLDLPGIWNGLGAGSNNWVIGPKKSATGNALLANDPHVSLTHPPFWFWAHLKAGSIDAIGASFPGIPIITMGSTTRVSWGVTNSYLPVSRLSWVPESELKVAPGMLRVRPWIWVKFWKFQLPFFFKTFQRTPKGLPVLPIESPLGSPKDLAIVLQWTGFDLKASDILNLLELPKAKTVQEADQLLSQVNVPSWNLVFADTHGGIGYRAIGRVPRFAVAPHFGIQQESLAAIENSESFKSPLNSNEMPHLLNPKRGFLATANNRQWQSDSKWSSGTAHALGFRGFRIDELIDQTPLHTVQSVGKIQGDLQAVDARFLLPELLKKMQNSAEVRAVSTVPGEGSKSELADLQLLDKWNYETGLSCQACGLYRRWMDRILSRFKYNIPALYRELKKYKVDPEFQNGLRQEFHLARVDIETVKEGPLPLWGDLHVNSFTHLLGKEWFPTKAIGTPGDDFSVNPGTSDWDGKLYQQRAGASQRIIIEMSQPVQVYSAVAGPQQDVENRDLKDPQSAWQKWLNLKQNKRLFPLDWSQVEGRIQKVGL